MVGLAGKGLLKKDIKGGTVNIKSGSLTITTDDVGNTYMKRIYMDDVTMMVFTLRAMF